MNKIENEDFLAAKRIVNQIILGDTTTKLVIVSEESQGKYTTLIKIMDEAIDIFNKAKLAIKENSKIKKEKILNEKNKKVNINSGME